MRRDLDKSACARGDMRLNMWKPAYEYYAHVATWWSEW